ncbi:MAG TPA: hypothetical protein PK961_01715 [bacterium]|nr:hypothetical protein [bacterium]
MSTTIPIDACPAFIVCGFPAFGTITLSAGIVAGVFGLRQPGGLHIAAIAGVVVNALTLPGFGRSVPLGSARL